jgi:hypothetical protein
MHVACQPQAFVGFRLSAANNHHKSFQARRAKNSLRVKATTEKRTKAAIKPVGKQTRKTQKL